MVNEETDPAPHERLYYRSTQTGDRGWLVKRDGVEVIRLDRGAHEECVPFNETRWKRDLDVRPFTTWQTAQVAFAADRAICISLGMHEKSRKTWLDLTDEQRRKWTANGPGKPEVRQELYRAIMDVLSPLTG